MSKIVKAVCKQDVNHLGLVRSMPVRWNSVLAEITRGIALRPVSLFNVVWVSILIFYAGC